ncbi:ribosomal protein S5, C-terminal domain-containing protein [Xylogone sp. PMI_703]|nr:ribosomal protein S5, C-terminal domain-containing protein [Xylogone sp. PMI_703]
MSVLRPARCLYMAPSIPKARPHVRCQNFHTSPHLHERRRPRFASVKASEMGLVQNTPPAREIFKPYSKEETEALSKIYTPEQMKAIEAGEQAIDPEDLQSHGVLRSDPGMLPYLDDLSTVQPVIDKRPKNYQPLDQKERWQTPEELAGEMLEWWEKVHVEPEGSMNPEDPKYLAAVRPNRLDALRFEEESSGRTSGDGRPAPRSASSLAPAIPRVLDQDAIYQKEEGEEEDSRDPDGIYNRLRKQTGLTLDEILDLKAKILVRHRVVNQTRMGKIQSMYCLAIAGNQNGRLGIGESKGIEVEETMNNAKIAAIRNMQPIPRYEERTIYGEVNGKVAAAEVTLMARPPGYGLRCQHNIFEMARAAGIQDLSARVPRSRNKMNTIKATYQALMSQRLPDEIARGRGKKLVDVRRVYYGGRV